MGNKHNIISIKQTTNWSKSQGSFNRNQWRDVWLVYLGRAILGLYENAALKCT